MYRIHFDHRIGRFVIQVLIYKLFWCDVARSSDIDPLSKRATFLTLTEAREYVKSIGLDQLYHDKSADQFNRYMAAESLGNVNLILDASIAK